MQRFFQQWWSVIRGAGLSPADESAFQLEFRRRSFQISLLVLLVSAVASTALLWLDLRGHGAAVPGTGQITLRLVLAWLPPLLMLTLHSWSERSYPWVIAAAVTISLSFSLLQPFYAAVVEASRVPTAEELRGLQLRTVIVTFFITALLQLPFRFAAVLAVANYAVFAAIQISGRLPETPSVLLRIGLVVFLGMLVSLVIQARERRLYAAKLELERGKEQLELAHAESERRLQNYLDTQEAARLEIKSLEKAAISERNERLQFIRDMLHDMRGIISALGGSLENYELATTQQKADLASRAAANVKRAYGLTHRLTEDLFTLSTYELGRASPPLEPVDLDELLAVIHGAYADKATNKGIELRLFRARTRGAICRSNDNALHRVLVNLVANAVKFTAPRPARVSGVVMGASVQGNYVVIRVWDTGVGIHESRLEEIWKYGETTSGTNAEKGYGIGLPTVRAICRSLPEHEITISSKPGKGSRFTIRVPLEDVRVPVQAEAPETESYRTLEGMNVLVVDDSESYLESETLLVSLSGGTPVPAENVRGACEACAALGRAPDLIITDFHLRDGEKATDVIAALRASWASEIPAIVVTGDLSPIPREALAGIRAAILLRKPLTRKALTREAARLLDAEVAA